MTGIWLHQSGGLSNDEELLEVDGSKENVDDDVVFCLGKEIDAIIHFPKTCIFLSKPQK